MSIKKIQTERALEDIARMMLASGVQPTLNDVMRIAAQYFSLFPPGLPLPMAVADILDGQPSNVKNFNEIFSHIAENLDVLYEESKNQVDEVMTLHSVFNHELDSLRTRRRRLEAKVDDLLLGQYNTDGYFFSFSDIFTDLNFTDLNLTSAFIDTTLGVAMLPTLSNLTKTVNSSQVQKGSIAVKANNVAVSWKELSPFSNAMDGLTNTFWAVEVETLAPAEVVLTFDITVARPNDLLILSRIDFDPYGMVPTQVFIETSTANTVDTTAKKNNFGGLIQTSLYRMSFMAPARDVQQAYFTLRKTEPDYTLQDGGTVKYRYILGAKEIALLENIYDKEARFVSSPIAIPDSFKNDYLIDAVSVTTTTRTQPNTDIKYYVAADVQGATSVGEFNWRPIVPVGTVGAEDATVVRFDGAAVIQRMIRSQPTGNDIQLIPFDSLNSDLTKQNPSSVIVPSVDVYRIANFDADPLLNSLSLVEGLNSTRIFYTGLLEGTTNDLAYWAANRDGSEASTAYGQIDTGNDFFYGGDVGQSGVSVYVETFLDVQENRDNPLVAEFQKTDPPSQTWDVKVFLNGRNIGSLPAGTDRQLIPWPFMKGLNHVVLLINIPRPTTVQPYPYTGTVKLLGDNNLSNFGTVRLDAWSYVDFFDFQYNSLPNAKTFTIKDGEIISRRRPTDNLRLQYATTTNSGPSSVRFRADFSRSIENPHVSPVLDQYRLRFAYGAIS